MTDFKYKSITWCGSYVAVQFLKGDEVVEGICTILELPLLDPENPQLLLQTDKRYAVLRPNTRVMFEDLPMAPQAGLIHHYNKTKNIVFERPYTQITEEVPFEQIIFSHQLCDGTIDELVEALFIHDAAGNRLNAKFMIPFEMSEFENTDELEAFSAYCDGMGLQPSRGDYLWLTTRPNEDYFQEIIESYKDTLRSEDDASFDVGAFYLELCAKEWLLAKFRNEQKLSRSCS